MIANAVFVATLIFLALGFWLMRALHFLVPWRSLILHSYLPSIALYCALLFVICARKRRPVSATTPRPPTWPPSPPESSTTTT